jgi:TolB-like protein
MDSSFLDTKSIAVARFDNLSTNPALEHLAAGLAEDISTELSQFANLRIVESENGGPEFVMKGTIGEIGSEVRLSVKLVRTRDMSTFWAETYDQPSEQAHELRRSRSKNIAYMIRDMIALDGIAGGLLDAGFEREAVDYYVRAQREYSDWTFGMGSDSDVRVTYLNRAIASAPDLLGAHFFLAISYSQRLGGAPWRDMRTRAHEALEELAAVQPDSWLTSYAHGQISYELDLDYAAAEGYFLEAADRLPEVASSLLMPLIDSQIATMRLQQGRVNEALSGFRVAASGGSHMDQPWMLRGQAQALILKGNYAAAVAVLGDAFAVTGRRADDITTVILLSKAHACYLMGNNACANEVLDHAWSLYGSRRPEWFPGMMAALGRHDVARDLLAEAERLTAAGVYVDPAQVFSGYYQLGATDEAFVWLNRAIEERVGHLFPFLRSPQFYGDIRSDSRFRQAMDRLDEIEKWPHEIDSKGILNEE